MRLAMLAICVLSAPAFAYKPTQELPHQWVVEFVGEDGQFSRIFSGYPTKEVCEAALPMVLKQQNGFNGHCIEYKFDHEKGHQFIGSQDPAIH